MNSRATKNKYTIISIYSIYVSLIPILQYYKSPIAIFNLATFMAVFFLCLFVVIGLAGRSFVIRIESGHKPVRLYMLYITLNVIATTIYYNRQINWENLNAYIRMIVLFTSLILLGHSFFDKDIAINVLRKVLVLCSFVILLQDILYYVFSLSISFTIPQLLTEADYALVSNRFSGLYMEPAHFSQCAILYLCLDIFDEKKNSNSGGGWENIVIIGGVILSGSGQGYLLLGLLYLAWMIVSFNRKRISQTKFLALLSSAIVVVIGANLLSRTELVSRALSRIVSERGVFNSVAFVGRTYTNIFFDNLSNAQKWLGVGFGHEYEIVNKGLYINSVYAHLIQCGYTSIPLLIIVFLLLLRQGGLKERIYIPLYMLTMYFAATGNPMLLCFNFLYLLPESKE